MRPSQTKRTLEFLVDQENVKELDTTLVFELIRTIITDTKQFVK